jgi:hypothetical protein
MKNMKSGNVFRFAIAMNNIATLLIKRRLYSDALTVLNEAMAACRLYSLQPSQNPPMLDACDRSIDEFDSHDMQQRAEKLLCSAQNEHFFDSILIETVHVSDLEHIENITPVLLSHNSEYPILFPICIDDLDFSDRSDTDIDFECGIMLYNCAIAHCCLWRSLSTLSSLDRFESAVQLMLMCHKLCSETIITLEGDTPILKRFMHVEASMLSTLVLILGKSSNSKHHDATKMFIVILKNIVAAAAEIAESDRHFFGQNESKSAAAA